MIIHRSVSRIWQMGLNWGDGQSSLHVKLGLQNKFDGSREASPNCPPKYASDCTMSKKLNRTIYLETEYIFARIAINQQSGHIHIVRTWRYFSSPSRNVMSYYRPLLPTNRWFTVLVIPEDAPKINCIGADWPRTHIGWTASVRLTQSTSDRLTDVEWTG